MIVWFIDTSVLCPFLRVPGFEQDSSPIKRDFDQRYTAGDRFVIPITTVIETGNHICNALGDRRAAAKRLYDVLEAALEERVPFRINQIQWSPQFLRALLAGDSTSVDFVDLLGSQLLGVGDISILVERDHLAQNSSNLDLRIWTLDRKLAAYT